MEQWVKNLSTVTLGRCGGAGLIPGFTQWVKDLALHELWCGWQTQLGSGIAVAMA